MIPIDLEEIGQQSRISIWDNIEDYLLIAEGTNSATWREKVLFSYLKMQRGHAYDDEGKQQISFQMMHSVTTSTVSIFRCTPHVVDLTNPK